MKKEYKKLTKGNIVPDEIISRFKELHTKFKIHDITSSENIELLEIPLRYPAIESVLPEEMILFRDKLIEGRYLFLHGEVQEGTESQSQQAEYKMLKNQHPKLQNLVDELDLGFAAINYIISCKRLEDTKDATSQKNPVHNITPLKEQLDTNQHSLAQSSSQTEQSSNEWFSFQDRSRWGYENLRQVVKASGLSNAHCDFTKQGKPDLVVHLPGDRHILIKSQVPDLSFLNELDTSDPAQRRAAIWKHGKKMRMWVQHLADRNFPQHIEGALETVLMFVPAESLSNTLLEGDPDLVVWAAERRISLATPTSLLALLRSVKVSWEYPTQSEQARGTTIQMDQLSKDKNTTSLHDASLSPISNTSRSNPNSDIKKSVQLIRRDNKVVSWNQDKIEITIRSAFLSQERDSSPAVAVAVAVAVTDRVKNSGEALVHIEDVYDIIKQELLKAGHYKVAEAFILYRSQRALQRTCDLIYQNE